MKAWTLQNIIDDEGISLVFASTISDAKRQAYMDSTYIYQKDLMPDKWTDIRATRTPQMDGMEDESELTIVLKLLECGWWFELNGKRYDEENIEEFKRDMGMQDCLV